MNIRGTRFFLSMSLLLYISSVQALEINKPREKNNFPFPQKIFNTELPQNNIYFHGGSVMGTTPETIPNIYYIWYGDWLNNNPAIDLLTNFGLGVGKTDYYNIVHTYRDKKGSAVIRAVNFPKPGIFDGYSQGKALSDHDVYHIVKNAIKTKQLPLDKNGIYFVLASPDVNELSGLCIDYCSWHANHKYNHTRIKYAFIGNPERCPTKCSAQTVTPNNNLAADGMANMIAHELVESVTDPNDFGWYDFRGRGMADKCAWHFGYTKVDSNGAQYNLSIAFKNYLVQSLWLNNDGGYCTNRFYGA